MQTLIIFILPCVIFCTWGIAAFAQNAAEWWRQKKTRIQYLEQQVTALEAFKNTVKKGYKTAEDSNHTIENGKEIDQLLHLTKDGQLKMLEGERLQAIRSIGDDAGASLAFVLWYKEETNGLISEKQQEPGDIDHLIILFP